MFIPISVGSGTVTQTFTPALSGDLTAECRVQYEDVWYNAGEVVRIRRGNEVTLQTDALEGKDVVLTLDGVDFIWYIRKPTELATVENGGFHGLVGEYTELTVGDKVLTLQEGAGNPDLFIPDYGNELLMTVDLQTGNFKAVEAPAIISAVAVTEKQDTNIPFIVVAALRTETGFDLVFYNHLLEEISRTPKVSTLDRVAVYDHHGNVGVILTPTTHDIHSKYGEFKYQTTNQPHHLRTNTASGYHIAGTLAGTFYVAWGTNAATGNIISGAILPKTSASSIIVADERDGRIAILDRTSGMLHEGTLASNQFNSYYVGDEGAISSMLVAEEGVLLGFFDNGIRRYVDGVFVEQVSEAGTSFMVQDDVLIATRLHATDIVYNVKQVVRTLEPRQVNRNTATSLTIDYVAEVGGPAELINTLGTVTVDGKPFDGLLPAECKIVFNMPGSATFHHFRKMGVVGAAVYEWDVLTQPNLTINPVTLPPRYDAQIRTYEVEPIEISGITEGYFEELYVTNPNAEMRVNGGEWGDTVSVTTNDVVEIRWYLERYGAKYDPNIEIRLVRNNALLGSWYVLKMELDGVEVEKRHDESFKRIDLIVEEVREVTAEATAERRRADNFELTLTEAGMSANSEPTYVKLGDADTIGSKLSACQLDQIVKDPTSAYMHPLASEVQIQVRSAQQEVLPRGLFRNRIESNDIGSEVRPSTSVDSADVDYVALSNPTSAEANEPDAYARAKSAAELASIDYDHYTRAAFWADSLVSGWKNRSASTKVDANGYARQPMVQLKSDIYSGVYTGHDELLYSSGPNVMPEYDVLSFNANGEMRKPHDIVGIGAVSGVRESHTEHLIPIAVDGAQSRGMFRDFGLDGTASPAGKLFRDFGLTSEYDTSGRIFRDFPVQPSTVKYRIVEFSLSVAGANTTPSREFELEGSANKPTATRDFEVDAGADVGAKIIVFSAEVTFRKSNFREIAVGDARFTFEQAEDEFELYSEGSVPELVEVDGSYIVRTLPQLEDPDCKPEDVIDSKRKSFGYLGGG